MRKRIPIVIGGGVALLVASQYLNFGLGFTDGDGINEAPEDPALVSLEEAISDVESFMPETVPGTEAAESAAAESAAAEMELVPATPSLPEVVDIVIDDNQYWVAMNAGDMDQREAKSLDEIIAMASTLEGEESGVRVRIARTPDAIASAEAAVLSRLKEAGLSDDAIDSRRQLVERSFER